MNNFLKVSSPVAAMLLIAQSLGCSSRMSCTYVEEEVCVEFGKGYEAEQAEDECASGGTFSPSEACETSGVVAQCEITNDDLSKTAYYYSEDAANLGEEACSGESGTWSEE